MIDFKNIDWKYITGGVSMVFSIVFLIISPGWYLVVSCSAYVALFCFIGLGVCLIFHEKNWSRTVAYPFGVFLLASFVGMFAANKKSNKEKENERVADATYLISSEFESPHYEWLERAYVDGHAVFFLIDVKKTRNISAFSSGLINQPEVDRYIASLQQIDTLDLDYFPLSTHLMFWKGAKGSKQINAKYYLSYADDRYLKKGWEKTKGIELLPESVNKVIEGTRCMKAKDWRGARRCYELADSMGNATGTSILADWYGSGYNQGPDPEKCDSLHLAAAKAGSRHSRYDWS